MPGRPTRDQVAALVDHTLLKPEATAAEVAAVAAEAAALGVYAVCVSPSMVPNANTAGVRVAAVAGFPSGKHLPEMKAREAALAVASGASEIDMVLRVGDLIAGDTGLVRDRHRGRRQGRAHGVATTRAQGDSGDGRGGLPTSRLWPGCRWRGRGSRADFVKTSTGFHPAGGATVAAVRLMADAVGGRLGVKASGGIRTAADALAMLDAGATRLGLSGTRAVLDGLD